MSGDACGHMKDNMKLFYLACLHREVAITSVRASRSLRESCPLYPLSLLWALFIVSCYDNHDSGERV